MVVPRGYSYVYNVSYVLDLDINCRNYMVSWLLSKLSLFLNLPIRMSASFVLYSSAFLLVEKETLHS